jgi:hypothetical protein
MHTENKQHMHIHTLRMLQNDATSPPLGRHAPSHTVLKRPLSGPPIYHKRSNFCYRLTELVYTDPCLIPVRLIHQHADIKYPFSVMGDGTSKMAWILGGTKKFRRYGLHCKPCLLKQEESAFIKLVYQAEVLLRGKMA